MTTSYPSASRLKRSPSARCRSSSTTRILLMTPSLSNEGQLHDEGAPLPRSAALRVDFSAVPRDDGADDEEPQPGALDARRDRAGNAVEAFEDPLLLGRQNP